MPDALPDIFEPAHHLAHNAQHPPAAGAAPPAASAADSSADAPACTEQPPAAAAGQGDVLSTAGHGPTKAAVQATAAAAGRVSLVRGGCPTPSLLVAAGCGPSVTLCSAGWLTEVRFCSSRAATCVPTFQQTPRRGVVRVSSALHNLGLFTTECSNVPANWILCRPHNQDPGTELTLHRECICLWTAQASCLVHAAFAPCNSTCSVTRAVGAVGARHELAHQSEGWPDGASAGFWSGPNNTPAELQCSHRPEVGHHSSLPSKLQDDHQAGWAMPQCNTSVVPKLPIPFPSPA